MEVVIVDRKEDMSPDGYLRLIMEADGDVIVSVASGARGGGLDRFIFADVQFCTTFGGGGRSPETHKALRALMLAMAQDNQNGNQTARQEFSGEEIIVGLKEEQRNEAGQPRSHTVEN